MSSAPALTLQQLETAILADVVMRFMNLQEPTSRYCLLVKYEGKPAWQAISNLTSRNLLRNRKLNVPTAEEEYVPTAFSFELCGIPEFRQMAKTATTVVLHTVKQMFKGEKRKEPFVLDDLERHVEQLFPGQKFDVETLGLGLYLATDFHVINAAIAPNGLSIDSFYINEAAIGMPNPETEWDRIMSAIKPVSQPLSGANTASAQTPDKWEEIKPLGEGGQSTVFLVRSPERVAQRAACLQRIRTALDGDKRAELAEAVTSYGRADSLFELGALKKFKMAKAGESLTPLPESEAYEAIERLKNEIAVLSQARAGLPKLLASNVEQRWIVTEYFPEGTLDKHPNKFRGKGHAALKAFRSVVQTVALLHKDGYVHRDIKPHNVFIRNDEELALGDFGIVYLPNVSDRVTLTGERVGPRDYMPQWANLGVRHEKVEPCFDVYMLGKLLWSMVDGRMFLPREYHREPEFDLTKTFPGDPDMFLINRVLDKCVVERSANCLSSAQDLLMMVDAIQSALARGGQLLTEGVPRPCHVCGTGSYQVHRLRKENATASMRLWMSGGATDIEVVGVQLFSCDSCGNIQFFRT